MKRIQLGGILVLSLAAVTACSGGGLNAASPSTSGAPAASSASSPAAANTEGSITNDPTDRKDVTMSACGVADGGWTAGGKVSNTGKQDGEYTIVVSFTNKKSTVLARETATVKVPAGKSTEWKVDAKFKAPKDVVCVLRGVDRA